MRNTRVVLVAALAMAVGTPSCAVWPFHKKKATPVPPPAPTATAPVVRPKPREVSLPAPPEIPARKPDLSQAGPAVPVEPLPQPPRRRPKPRPHEDTDAAPPATPEPEPPAVPLPQFEQVLTPEQTKAYNEEIERNIGDAQKAVAMVESRRLNGEQTTYLARVRAFIDQANEARKADLFRARNLSERARVLAEDLLKSVQ